jgi:hypothetical protein
MVRILSEPEDVLDGDVGNAPTPGDGVQVNDDRSEKRPDAG